MTAIDQSVRTVAYGAEGLRIDGARVPLVAGSMEYWRLISLKWRTCLQAMKGAGLDLVSSFVCWDFHELEDGTFDFTGVTHPSRDLAGWLDMCAEEGLDVMLRTGPIIDAEWPTRGPAPDVCQLERIDPRYRARCEEYLAALYEVAVPRLATNGGPIVMVAVDNEPYFPYATDEESDPSEGSIPIPYQRDVVLAAYSKWLDGRYGSDDALRAAWSDADVSIVRPREPDYQTDSTRALLDSFEFITDTIAETYTWMRDFSRSRGVDVPIYSNMKPLSQYIGWQQIEQVVDGHGIGLFMRNMIPGDQALVMSWYVRLARAVTRFPFAAEFQSLAPMGQEEVFGVLSDDHQRYITELALALGLRGLAYYVFVERDDAGGAPISPLGKVRPRLEQVKRGIEMAKAVEADRQLYEVGLLWSYDHHRLWATERFSGWDKLYHCWIGMNTPQELSPWWEAFRALHEQDIDFAIVPLPDAQGDKTLLYAGPGQVRVEDWQKVTEAVESGATLLAVSLPTESIDGDARHIEALNDRLRSSGRLVAQQDASAAELLKSVAVDTPVHSDTVGVWTTAYETHATVWFFVANTTEQSVRPRVALATGLAASLAGGSATDVVNGESLRLVDGVIGDFELPPKRARAFTVPKEAM
jgi:hypothetical protein